MKTSACLPLTVMVLLLLFSSCRKDNSLVDTSTTEQVKTYSNVSPNLWNYFQRFEEEALSRGFFVDLNQQELTAEIMEISEEGVAGTCTYSSLAPNHIVIDQSFWNQSGDLFREMVIFHELGHCVLFRDHREDAFANGACASIMRSGIGGCFDNYQQATRTYYLDELFGLVN